MKTTKLYIPEIDMHYVPRLGIEETLGLASIRRLSLVTAGAGYGKTTALAGWCTQLKSTDIDVCWLSLDHEDNDPIRFMYYLLSSLSTCVKGLFDDVIERILSPHQPPIDWIVTACIDRLDASETIRQLVVVVDDFHHIKDSAIFQAIDDLITYCPTQLHVVLSSREYPRLPLSRYRSKGWLTEVGIDKLVLSPSETKRIFALELGLDLKNTEQLPLEQLTRRTEGWITGIRLAIASMQNGERSLSETIDVEHLEQAYVGSQDHVMAYLTEVIFENLTELEKTILMLTSIPAQFNKNLAHLLVNEVGRILGTHNEYSYNQISGSIEGFREKHLMMVTLGDSREWFRYHHLFEAFLKSHLQKWLASPEILKKGLSVQHLQQVVSQFFLNQSMALDALKHATEAGNIDFTAGILMSGPVPLLYRGATDAGLRWLSELPRHELDKRPWLWMMIAASDFYLGRTADLEYRLKQTESAMLQHLNPDSAESHMLNLQLSSIKGIHCAIQHQFDEAMVHATFVLKEATLSNEALRCAALWVLGYAKLSTEQYDEAYDYLMDARMVSRQCGHTLMWLMSTISFGKLKQLRFKYDEALKIYQEVLSFDAHKSYPVTCDMYIELATIYSDRGQYRDAFNYLEEAEHLVAYIDKTDRKLRCHLLRARLLGIEGALDKATLALEHAQRELKSNHYAHRHNELTFEQGKLLLMQGNLNAVDLLLKLRYSDRLDVRYKHLKGDGRAAIQMLEKIVERETSDKHYRELTEDLVVLAIAYNTFGNLPKGAETLQKALDLALENQMTNPFTEAGLPLINLLEKSGLEPLNYSMVKNIRAAIEMRVERGQGQLIEALTPREADVLKLMAEGLSNEEIAAHLFLAVSSVKGVNQRVFSKLQVSRRTEAVVKAKKLGLFS